MQIIADASAFIHGIVFSILKESDVILTTPQVSYEIKEELSREKFLAYLKENRVLIREPEKEKTKKIREEAQKIGSSEILSDEDVSLLALALELKERKENYVLATNDLAVQNLAEILGINYMPVSGAKIKKTFKWHFVCRGCGKKFEQNKKLCDVCGSEVRRRVKR